MNAIRSLGGLAALAFTTTAIPMAYADTEVAKQPTTTEAEKEMVSEEGSPFSVEFSMDILSDYVWRGMICNDNPVWQPSVTLGYDTGDYGALSANIWSTFDLTHKRGTFNNSRRSAGLQEIDYTISYAIELAGIGFEVGHIWYTYPNNNGSSDQDLYATVSYENPFVTPSASVYWNYSDSCGNDVSCLYYTFGLSHDFTITDALSLTPSASLSFGGNAWTDCGNELTDQTVGLSASYELCDNVSLGAQINYTWIPSHTLRKGDYMGEGKDQLCWGGINVTVSF
ncbi:MAG: TorF family putative porin [Kiritimatiellia bacterium]